MASLFDRSLSSGLWKGKDWNSIAYNMTPQHHTSARCRHRWKGVSITITSHEHSGPIKGIHSIGIPKRPKVIVSMVFKVADWQREQSCAWHGLSFRRNQALSSSHPHKTAQSTTQGNYRLSQPMNNLIKKSNLETTLTDVQNKGHRGPWY